MKGVHVAETRIGTGLRTVQQPYHEARHQVCSCARVNSFIKLLIVFGLKE